MEKKLIGIDEFIFVKPDKLKQLAKNVKPKSGPTVDVRPLGGEMTKKPQQAQQQNQQSKGFNVGVTKVIGGKAGLVSA